LAQYYKYIDPVQHIAYYQKHLHCLNQAFQMMYTNNPAPSAGARHEQEAKVWLFHGSPDAGPIDIYLDGTRILKGFFYKEVSGYAVLPAGKHQIDIYPAGSMISVLLSRKTLAAADNFYTIAAAGTSAELKLVLLEDQPEVPDGETKVRFAHLSHDAPAVDIAVQNRDVVFPNISFRQASKYMALTPMTVDMDARVAGTPNEVLSIPQIQFKANQAYTLLAVGSVAKEPELEALIIED
jgi:Domain of unknown function (DUF4397)